MTTAKPILVVNNISLPICASSEEALSVARARLKKQGIAAKQSDLFIFKRSIDARKRDNIQFVYSVGYHSPGYDPTPRFKGVAGFGIIDIQDPTVIYGENKQSLPFAVIGAGPAGLFSALTLAEAGFKVEVFERGGSISERVATVQRFISTRVLDEDTNIQFGAGGAGTFSDGKLVTRLNDPLSHYILRRFVEFGAPEEILTLAKPHIGTDILSDVVNNMVERLIELGSSVHFNRRIDDFRFSANKVTAVISGGVEHPCEAVILAIGHSARDTYIKLLEKDLDIDCKDFSVGLRIEHSRRMINESLYGDSAELLPAAEYNLSWNTKQRGVYTFCMCPGGEVVAATSETGGVVVNGMSKHSRAGDNSNSAVCCSVFKGDYGNSPIKAIEFQREIERRAYLAGGSDYSAPIITVGDFLSDKCSTLPSRIQPTYMAGGGVKLAHPSLYLPDFCVSGIKNAISAFDKRISGFASADAVLTGPETRTSSPLRILRSGDTRASLKYFNLYPCGEGAGYAGGITSAAIDGVKCALSLIKSFKP